MDHGSISGSWAGWPDLAEFRRSRKISVHQIVALTNIRTDYLTAIERGDFDKLPGGIYTTSYIRQYARIIDYPEQDLLAAYDTKMGAATPARIECQEKSPAGSSCPRFFRWLSSRVF